MSSNSANLAPFTKLRLKAYSQHTNWPELTQLHGTFIGHARQRHDYAVRIDWLQQN